MIQNLASHHQATGLQRSHSVPQPCYARTRVTATTHENARVTLCGWNRSSLTAACSARTAQATTTIRSGPAFKPSRRTAVTVQAGWGAPVDWKPATVTVNRPAATGLHTLVVDVGADLAAGYTKPGQYMQVKVGDSKPGFFAIACAPDPNNQGSLEFLIKAAPGSAAELLCAAEAGAAVSVSPVQGKGFPVERVAAAATPTLLLFASGSGITPIRAAVESGTLEVAARAHVRLYYGTKDADATAFRDALPQWERQGVTVQQVYSGEGGRYIQDVLAADLDSGALSVGDGSGAGALLCGHKDMCQKVTALLTARGVPAEKILLNF